MDLRKWGETGSFGPRQWLRHRLLLKELKAGLPEGAVLDAGCGEGRLALLIANRGYQVSGFDPSGESLKQARERNPGLTFWSGKMDSIPVPDQSFDAVISGEVLEHLEDDRAAVREIYRVLKPGGLAIVSVPADPLKWSIDDEWSGHKRRYTEPGLEKIFQDAGFQKEKIRRWGWPVIWSYAYFYYIPRLRRKTQAGPQAALPAGLKDSRLIRALFWIALTPDRIFSKAPFGIGLIGSFRKPAR